MKTWENILKTWENDRNIFLSCGPSLWQCQWCRPFGAVDARTVRPKAVSTPGLCNTSCCGELKRYEKASFFLDMLRVLSPYCLKCLGLSLISFFSGFSPWPNSHCSSGLWTCHWPERQRQERQECKLWAAPDRARAKPLQHRCPWQNCEKMKKKNKQ